MRKAGKGQGGLGYIRVGEEAVGLPEGAARAAMEQSAEAAHTADVGQLFGGSCRLLVALCGCVCVCGGAHPEGGVVGGFGDGGKQAGECVSLSCHPPQRRPD